MDKQNQRARLYLDLLNLRHKPLTPLHNIYIPFTTALQSCRNAAKHLLTLLYVTALKVIVNISETINHIRILYQKSYV